MSSQRDRELPSACQTRFLFSKHLVSIIHPRVLLAPSLVDRKQTLTSSGNHSVVFFFCFFRASQKTAPFFQLLKGAVSVQRCLGVSQAAVHNLDCSRCSKPRMNSCQAPLPAAHTDVPRPSQTQPVAQKYPQICLELSVSALFGS